MGELGGADPEISKERRRVLIASHRRWRLVFLALAIVVPALLHLLFERQARRLDALADHGQLATATVTGVSHDGPDGIATYEYRVGTERYAWSVKASQLPPAAGSAIPIIFLPEHPTLSRPGADRTRASVEASSNRRFARGFMLGVLLFVAVNAGLSEMKLRKLVHGESLRVSPEWAGRIVALLVLAGVLSTNLFADVAAVQQRAFGTSPLGIPVLVLVSLVEVLLFAPLFWVFEHLMRLALRAIRDNGGLSRIALVLYILRVSSAHPELIRSRNIVLVGLAYTVALLAGWILYASHEGL